MRLEDDFLVWKVDWSTDTGPRNRIAGYNFSNGKLSLIAAEEDSHHTLPWLSKGRVVYYVEAGDNTSRAASGPFIEVWDSKTLTRSPIETGVEGRALPKGLAGNWLMVEAEGASDSSLDGIWVVNLTNGDRRHLFAPSLVEPPLYEHQLAEAITGNSALVAVSRYNTETKTGSSTIIEFDLVSNDSRVVFQKDQSQINRMDVSERYVVLEVGETPQRSSIQWIDRRTGSVNVLSQIREEQTAFPSVGGDWAFYHHLSKGEDFQEIVGVNLSSGQRFQVLKWNSLAGVLTETDGSRVILELIRQSTEIFDSTYWDLYWKPLPLTNPGAS